MIFHSYVGLPEGNKTMRTLKLLILVGQLLPKPWAIGILTSQHTLNISPLNAAGCGSFFSHPPTAVSDPTHSSQNLTRKEQQIQPLTRTSGPYKSYLGLQSHLHVDRSGSIVTFVEGWYHLVSQFNVVVTPVLSRNNPNCTGKSCRSALPHHVLLLVSTFLLGLLGLRLVCLATVQP